MKQLFNNTQASAGQSIVEVLVATAVVAVVITAIASGLTLSVKNTSEAKFKTAATSMAQEALEIYRRERVLLGWESFRDTLGAGGTFCVNTLPTTSTEFAAMAVGACTQGVAQTGTEFRRQTLVTPVNLDADPEPEEVQVVATTSWYDGNTQRSVAVEQHFREWQ